MKRTWTITGVDDVTAVRIPVGQQFESIPFQRTRFCEPVPQAAHGGLGPALHHRGDQDHQQPRAHGRQGREIAERSNRRARVDRLAN